MQKLVSVGLAIVGWTVFAVTAGAAAQQRDFAPRVSPDGEWLVYYSYRDDAAPDLFILNLETGEERALTETPDVWEIEPHWSWDGRHVLFGAGAGMPDIRPAFLELDDGRPADRVRRFDGAPAGMKRVTAVEPGESVLYVQEYGLPARHRFSVYRDGDGVTPWLESMPEGEFAAPLLSPGGDFLVAVREWEGQTDLVRVERSTGIVTALTDTPEEEAYLAWSAEGRWLSWSQSNDVEGRQIFGLELDAEGRPLGPARALTPAEPGRVHFFSSISSDGAWVYFDIATDQGFEIRRRALEDTDGAGEVLP